MFPLFKHSLNNGDKVYVVSDPSVSEWVVDEVISAGHSSLYRLKKDGTDSFCVYEQSRLGKDLFTSKEDAMKERLKRKGG